MYSVYHEKSPTFGLGEPSKFPEGYELVAKVEAKSLEETFSLTNHIDCPWWENDGVEKIKESRSTSVGDVVVDPSGKVWGVGMVGWVER